MTDLINLDQFRKLARVHGVGGGTPELFKTGERLEAKLRRDGKHTEADEVYALCTRLMGLKELGCSRIA